MSRLRCETRAILGDMRNPRETSCSNDTENYSSSTLSTTGTEALAAQNWPSRLRLERHAVGLAALIANNFEALAFASASALAGSAKILPARVPARFTTLWVR